MTDDGDGAGVDDLLGGQRAFLRVGLVVFGDEVELVGLVADLQATGGVDLVRRLLGADQAGRDRSLGPDRLALERVRLVLRAVLERHARPELHD